MDSMEAIGLGGDANAQRRLDVLRAVDKLDKFGLEGVRLLLGEGRRDDSGDFTKGAGLTEEQASTVLFYVGITDFDASSGNLAILLAGSPVGVNGIAELDAISALVRGAGYDTSRIRIDPSVVRGLEYYTGPVFEAALTFDVPNEKGERVVFGSIGGGGRYDGLVSRFTGQAVPSTGFSIGVSRLMTALRNLGRIGAAQMSGPVLVTVMDGDIDSLVRFQRMTQALRAAGVRAEMYQGNWKKFGNQLKYADRRGSPIAIIQGSDERARGVVQVKDLIGGKLLSEGFTDNGEWRNARAAQTEVDEDNVVEAVREILARHAIGS